MKPKPITLDFLREIQLRVLDNPQNKRERVRIPAMPEISLAEWDAEATGHERPADYEFAPIKYIERDGRITWRHKFTGEVIL